MPPATAIPWSQRAHAGLTTIQILGIVFAILTAACARRTAFWPASDPSPPRLELGIGTSWEYSLFDSWPWMPGMIRHSDVTLQVVETLSYQSEWIELDSFADYGDLYGEWRQVPVTHFECPPHYISPLSLTIPPTGAREFRYEFPELVEGVSDTSESRSRLLDMLRAPVVTPTRVLGTRFQKDVRTRIDGRVARIEPISGMGQDLFTTCWLANTAVGPMDLTQGVVTYALGASPFQEREQEVITSLLRDQPLMEHDRRVHPSGGRLLLPGRYLHIAGWASPSWGWVVTDEQMEIRTPASTFTCVEIARYGKGLCDREDGRSLFVEYWTEGVGLVARVDLRGARTRAWVLTDWSGGSQAHP